MKESKGGMWKRNENMGRVLDFFLWLGNKENGEKYRV